jgi:capsular polysaccharide biosynthesis protein
VDPLSSDIGSVDLSEYLRRLRRRSWLVLLGVVVGVVGASFWTANQSEQYRSEASVLVLPAEAGMSATLVNGRTSGAINLDTEAQIVRSALIANVVSTTLTDAGGVAVPTAAELMEQIEVSVPPNSQVLQIGYVSATAGDAQVVAETYAKAYLAERSQSVTAAVEDARTRLTEQRDGLQSELSDLIDEIGELSELFTEPPELALAVARRDILLSQINAIDTEMATLDSVRTESGRLLTAAPLPSEPFAPNPTVDVAAGALVGLVLGVGLAILADRLDRRIRTTGDIERARFSVIGTIPGPRRRLTTLDAGRENGVDDAADRIRNRLVSYAGKAKVIQVAPASPNHGCGLAAAALAASFGREHGRALLIVADPESPVAQRLAGDPAGLSDLLIAGSRAEGAGPAPDEAVLVLPDELARVAIMGPGGNPAQLPRVLQPKAMTRLLQRLDDDYPIVLVETGHMGSATAQSVARAADIVVLVALRGASDARTMAATGENLSGLHARLGGVVLAPRLDPPAEDGPPLTIGFGPPAPASAHAGSSRPATRSGPAHSDRARSSRRRTSLSSPSRPSSPGTLSSPSTPSTTSSTSSSGSPTTGAVRTSGSLTNSGDASLERHEPVPTAGGRRS